MTSTDGTGEIIIGAGSLGKLDTQAGKSIFSPDRNNGCFYLNRTKLEKAEAYNCGCWRASRTFIGASKSSKEPYPR